MLEVTISYSWHFLPGSSSWIYFSSPVRMRLKNVLPLWQYWSKWFGHFVYSCIYALVNCFGTLLAHTSFRVESVVNDFMGREPWLWYMWGTTSSIGMWLFRSAVQNRSLFSWIENMDRCLHGSSSVMLLNNGSHSQTLHSVKHCSHMKLKFYQEIRFHLNLHTTWSPTQSDIHQRSYWYNWLSW
jgi:hypothetical protein